MIENKNFKEPYFGVKKVTLTIPQLIIGVVVTIVLSIASFFMLAGVFGISGQETAYSPFASSESRGLPSRLIDELANSYALIKKHYVGEFDENKLIDGALAGFTAGLGDQYTSYLNEAEMKSLQESIEGEFEGIGIEIESYEGYIRVVSPIDQSPAYKAGLQSGDVILAVDGKDIKGQSTSEVSKVVRGKKGTRVTLTVDRAGSKFDVTVTRDTIPNTTVKGAMNGTVGVLRISSFAEHTYDELVTKIKQLRESGAKSFVIDVRSNPGGLLESVKKIVNIFVKDGDIMVAMQDNESITAHRASKDFGTFKVTEPIAVLIDNGSASAAEIFAAAIKELGRGQLIGETSFGKGTAQTIRNLSSQTGIKITYSKWLTPKGNWIHQKGVEPDKVVKLPSYAYYAYTNVNTLPQLNDASDEILNIQKILAALDYKVSLTGIYDEQTANVVAQFNEANGINQTTFTAETATKLNELLRQKVSTHDVQLEEALNQLK
ncbi:S41 family peptidase [Carnobacteriaceae bacterium zg-C25]|nr:S41 family peptidase [Carnobacteriaceae bacterium zg-C25]